MIDSLVDDAFAALGVNATRPKLHAEDPSRTIAIIGFPRSGNTYLTSWLQWLAQPEVTVLDGRVTHSALDMHRLALADVSVVVPTREPLSTCSSLLVRWGEHLDIRVARGVLRAYRAWYQSAAHSLRASRPGTITFASFDDFTTDPACVGHWPGVSALLDLQRLETSQEFEAELHDRLAQEEGQGQPLDGVPGHQMISLPDQKRAPLLDEARDLLQSPGLSRYLDSAQDAYAQLVSNDYPESRTPSAIESPGK